MLMLKIKFYTRRRMSWVRIGGAGGRRNITLVICNREQ